MENLSIGQLAKKTGVNIQTIRYYERIGIIPKPQRRESGYRIYFTDEINRISFIKRAQELGFTLREIMDLLTLRVDPDTTCQDIKRRAEAKINEIEKKLKDLQRMKKALLKLAAACASSGPKGDCPILEALDSAN